MGAAVALLQIKEQIEALDSEHRCIAYWEGRAEIELMKAGEMARKPPRVEGRQGPADMLPPLSMSLSRLPQQRAGALRRSRRAPFPRRNTPPRGPGEGQATAMTTRRTMKPITPQTGLPHSPSSRHRPRGSMQEPQLGLLRVADGPLSTGAQGTRSAAVMHTPRMMTTHCLGSLTQSPCSQL